MLCSALISDAALANVAASTNAAAAFKQSSHHDQIKLRTTKIPTKQPKINDVNPLPAIERPSILGKAFQRQQYAKASDSSAR